MTVRDMTGRKKEASPQPHYHGHRERLRSKVLTKGAGSLSDYELIEFLLFGARPRGDVKPLAKTLLGKFGSLAGVLSAEHDALKAVPGTGQSATAYLKIVQEAARRLALEQASQASVIGSWEKLLAYCRIVMGHEKVEQFRIIFLDKKNQVIADELQQRGTVDHTPVYPREVVKRALELGATAIILVHNHPSGDPTPSKADIRMTREIKEAAERLGIIIHDHLVIGRAGHASFKSLGLL
jgi:DNA repair protein RadC